MSKTKRDAIDFINRMAAEHGIFGRSRGHSWLYWSPPRKWAGIKYYFGWTPHRTKHEGKVGFFAVKYRLLKNGNMKLKKSVRFGKRKVAKARSLQWHNNYYGENN